MKKLLLSSAALCGLAMVATPAQAQVSLELGGHFKGYGVMHSQDEDSTTSEERSFDILRETEVHFGGETTLDNGLTVGVHVEAEADGGDAFDVDESYAYFSGNWGRVNFGDEDGAAYLLQVAAPSADSNYDGIRQYVNPMRLDLIDLDGSGGVPDGDDDEAATALGFSTDGLDYDNDLSGNTEKFTYLSPIMNGFQVGLSYTPDIAGGTNSLGGVDLDDVAATLGEAYEGGLRYEGNFNNVGMILGAGYAQAELEEEDGSPTEDDLTEWNVGADFDIGAFGIGAAYTENNNGHDTEDEDETWVLGADYTTGPFKLGVSYLNKQVESTTDSTISAEADRYTLGVVYTYGPGMTFRGSVSQVEVDVSDAGVSSGSNDGTSVLLGTQINF